MSFEKQESEEAFLCEVCWHYFVNELTQAEVARLLGVTRLRVNQAISQAKAAGIYRIEISSPFVTRHELQTDLCKAFGLSKANVVPANRTNYEPHGPVGAALATHMMERLNEGAWRKVGVSWGGTLEKAISRLPKSSFPELDIVSMAGGTSTGSSFNTFSIASGFAEKVGANYSLFVAPIFLSPEADFEQFFAQDVFVDHRSKLDQLDAAVLVAGDISYRSNLVSTALPSDVSITDLEMNGAVGDVLGRFLDKDGNEVMPELSRRTVGVELETLKKVPEVILAAAGPYKVPIILAAIRRGFVQTLITDDVTAELLLEEAA